MKFLVLCIAFAALAAAEVHWDENGEYKLVESAPLAVRYAYAKNRAATPIDYAPLRAIAPIDYAPLRAAAPIDYAPLRTVAPIDYAPLRYYNSMKLREYKPFVYSYKQVIE